MRARKSRIDTLIKNAKTLEEKARKAFDLRNEYRSAARQYMSDCKLAEYLEEVEKNQVWEIKLSITLEKEDINSLEEAYYDIIASAYKGRDKVDILFKINK